MGAHEFLEEVLIQFGQMALTSNHEKKVWPALEVSRITMASIIVYDVYSYLNMTQAAGEWKMRETHAHYSIPRPGTFWFRDWYFEIYRQHGRASLRRFLELLQQPPSGTVETGSPDNENHSRLLNMGDFVHLWSSATGENLQDLARTSFGWNKTYQLEFSQAKLDFKNVDYTPRPLKLAFQDDNTRVRIYFKNRDNFPNPNTATYTTISNAWRYIKDNYTVISNESTCNIFLHNNNNSLTRLLDDPCLAHSEAVDPREPGFLNIYDCSTFDSNEFLTTNRNDFLDAILKEMTQIIFKEPSIGGGTRVSNKWPAWDVSGETITTILVYDLYLNLDMAQDSKRWSVSQLGESQPFPRGGTLWFQNWYLNIYQNYDGFPTLNNFLTSLRTLTAEEESAAQVNLGEFVHFWSGAANASLRDMAEIAFGWNETYQNHIIEARKAYPKVSYPWTPWRVQQPSPGNIETQNSLGVTVGLSVSFFTLLIGLGAAFGLYQRRIRKKRRKLTIEEVEQFLNGNSNVDKNEAHASIYSTSFNSTFELPQGKLVVDRYRILGSGEFGLVLHGLLTGTGTGTGTGSGQSESDSSEENIVVAVKTVKPNVEISHFLALLSEIKILTHLGAHENIVFLLGTVTKNIRNREVFVALEFCEKGDLLRYLRKHSDSFKKEERQLIQNSSKIVFTPNQNDSPSLTFQISSSPISKTDLIKWSSQIANGMTYLSSKNVIHGDLAARNILLTANSIAKISDFGLSRQMVNFAIYQKKSRTPIPWKWLALESLCEMKFSLQSDVWSLGVTLWEIFTLGRIPYAGKAWDTNFVNNLVSGVRLEAPEFGSERIYSLMMECWKKEPLHRIKIEQIASQLQEILTTNQSQRQFTLQDECIYSDIPLL